MGTVTDQNEDYFDFRAFLKQVDDSCTDFVDEVHQSLLEKGCKFKISSTKTYPFQVAYIMPNSRKGILNFWLRKKGLEVRITVVDVNKHVNILNQLPETMVNQINEKKDCHEKCGNGKCYDNCTGAFDFHIKATRYQKCLYDCFRFNVDAESTSFFVALLENEFQARLV